MLHNVLLLIDDTINVNKINKSFSHRLMIIKKGFECITLNIYKYMLIINSYILYFILVQNKNERGVLLRRMKDIL